MTLNELRKSVDEFLGDSRYKEAINLLKKEITPEAETLVNDLVVIEGNLASLKRQWGTQQARSDEYIQGMARINNGIQDVLQRIRPTDLIPSATDHAIRFRKSVEALGMNPLTRKAIVDCNRIAQLLAFQEAFRTNYRQKQPYQFYFITGCPSQRPESLAENLVYEVLERMLQGVENDIQYELSPFPLNKLKTRYLERVEPVNLPFNAYTGILEDHQALFRRYFESRLQKIQPADYPPLEEIIADPQKRLPHRVFVFLFRINLETSNWSDDLTEYLDWIIQTFKTNRSIPPLFKFIFVISRKQMHTKPDPVIETALTVLLNKHNSPQSTSCIRLATPEPVTEQDLIDWFSKWAGILKLEQIEAVVKDYCKHHRLDMAIVEEHLIDIYKITHQIDD